MQSHSLDDTYVHLGTGANVDLIDVTPDFWPTIDERPELHTGRLVTSFAFTEGWTTWEMHPAGDELILVTEGSVRFRLDDGDDISEVDVTAPSYVVVPAGVWHTADPIGAARIIVITWGEGTENRPR